MVFADGCFPVFYAVAAVDADKFDFALVLSVGFFHLWESLDAPATPAAPEVEHYPFATEVGERHVLAFKVDEGEVRGFDVACLHFGLAFLVGELLFEASLCRLYEWIVERVFGALTEECVEFHED